jgi:hypothetical protein
MPFQYTRKRRRQQDDEAALQANNVEDVSLDEEDEDSLHNYEHTVHKNGISQDDKEAGEGVQKAYLELSKRIEVIRLRLAQCSKR